MDVLHGHQQGRPAVVPSRIVDLHRRHAAGWRLSDIDVACAAGGTHEVDVSARVVRNFDRAHQQMKVALVDHLDARVAPGLHRSAAGNTGAVQEHVAASRVQRRKHQSATPVVFPYHVRQRLQGHASFGRWISTTQAIEEVPDAEIAERDHSGGKPRVRLPLTFMVDHDFQLVVAAGHHVAVDDHLTGSLSIGVAAALGHRDKAKLVSPPDAIRRQVQRGFGRPDGHVAGTEHLAAFCQSHIAMAGHINTRRCAGHSNQAPHVAFSIGSNGNPAVRQPVAVAAGQNVGIAQRLQRCRLTHLNGVRVVHINAAARTAHRGQAPGVHQRR